MTWDLEDEKETDVILKSSFKITRRGERFNISHRSDLSKIKKTYKKSGYRKAEYPAYLRYYRSLRCREEALDYPSYRRFVSYMALYMIYLVISRQKSFKVKYFGTLKSSFRPYSKLLQDAGKSGNTYTISLKYNKTTPIRVKRYRLRLNTGYKDHIKYLMSSVEDYNRDSYFFIKSKI